MANGAQSKDRDKDYSDRMDYVWRNIYRAAPKLVRNSEEVRAIFKRNASFEHIFKGLREFLYSYGVEDLSDKFFKIAT